jgi:hypothetical protein
VTEWAAERLQAILKEIQTEEGYGGQKMRLSALCFAGELTTDVTCSCRHCSVEKVG